MNTVKIGWGRRDVTTTEAVSIPGQSYTRVSDGVHDPLYVTALCVDGGEGQDAVVFCACDLIVLRGGVIQQTKDLVARMDPSIPTEAIIMGATHTHTGACVTDTPEKTRDGRQIYPGAKYREFFCQMCAEAICEAWSSRTRGGIAYGYGYAVVAHSRRVVYSADMGKDNYQTGVPNGYGAMYGNTNKPEFSHYEAGADHFLNAMFTFDANEKLTGIVVNVPCPSQVGEQLTVLSADYWNEVRTLAAKEFGPEVYILPQCAPSGDTSPRILHYKNAQARRMQLKYGKSYDTKNVKPGTQDYYDKIMCERWDIAERILDGLKDIYSWAKKDIQTQLAVSHNSRTMALERRVVTEEEKHWYKEKIRVLKELIPSAEEDPAKYRAAVLRYEDAIDWEQEVARRSAAQQAEPTVDVPAHVVRIGDIAFCTNRFELYQDFMHQVQARSPFIQTFVVQLAGTEGGNYLPTDRGVANKGYSTSVFCNAVSSGAGKQWVEEILEMLNQAAE